MFPSVFEVDRRTSVIFRDDDLRKVAEVFYQALATDEILLVSVHDVATVPPVVAGEDLPESHRSRNARDSP